MMITIQLVVELLVELKFLLLVQMQQSQRNLVPKPLNCRIALRFGSQKIRLGKL